jgi:hypothetical protein
MVGLSTGIGIGLCLVSSGTVSSCSVMFNTVETINASTIIARSASANGSHGRSRASGSTRERICTMSVGVVTGNSSENGTISVGSNSSGSVNLRACACAAGGADRGGRGVFGQEDNIDVVFMLRHIKLPHLFFFCVYNSYMKFRVSTYLGPPSDYERDPKKQNRYLTKTQWNNVI